MHSISRWQKIALLLGLADFFCVVLSYLLALYLRFDCQFTIIPSNYLAVVRKSLLIYALINVFIYWLARLYNCVWRFIGFHELFRCLVAGGVAIVLHCLAVSIVFGKMPVSYYAFGGFFQVALLVASRFSWRFLILLRSCSGSKKEGECENAMLIGGGAAGKIILRDLSTTEQRNIRFKCIIDDDPDKWGCYIEDVPIVGGRDKIEEAVKEFGIKKIFVALPRATAEQRRDILNICNETGCSTKVLPGLYQFTDDEVTLTKMRDVDVNDLLGREPIIVNTDDIYSNISNHVVLVTGGGGSIGSELCRQIACHTPKQLIIFDIYENNAYDIQQELKRHHPDLNLVVLIGSVRDSKRVEKVFDIYHPDMVFHAAAHKHVPLMEDSPCEAIKNNVLGTYKVAYAALTHGCKRFLLISTDKAVNPTNIMGASKRICEMIVQTMDKVARMGDISILPHADSHHGFHKEMIAGTPADMPRTEFVAVRFGNVLGSNGSVIPLFKKQIEEGGPVTVTDPKIIRYFMTIPEAVSLVLQSAAYAQGGEIFVLDMGEPVKIDTLARNLIKLSGLKPDVDIKIVYTGLRPGEKLYEEKLMSAEGLKTTPNKLIHIAEPIAMDKDVFLKQLDELVVVSALNTDEIVDVVKKVVTTYHKELLK